MKLINAVLILLLALPLAAQSGKDQPKPKPEGPMVTKVFQLKYADPNSVASLLEGLNRVGYSVRSSSQLHAVAVTAPPETMVGVEDAVKRLDVPSATARRGNENVDLTVYVLMADGEGPSGTLPAALQPVIDQLKNTFTYKSLGLLDTILLRVGSRSTATTSGVVTIGPEKTPDRLYIRTDGITPNSKGRLIHLDGLNFSVYLRVPSGSGSGFTPVEAKLDTSITVREGQLVVVGKSSIGDPDHSLILVLTARVVD